MAGQATLMASIINAKALTPFTRSSSNFVKLNVNSNATRLCCVVTQAGYRRTLKVGQKSLFSASSSTMPALKTKSAKAQLKLQAVASDNQQVAPVTHQEAEIYHIYRTPFLHANKAAALLRQVQKKISGDVIDIKTEQCHNIALNAPLSSEKWEVLNWLLRETYEPNNLQFTSNFESESGVVVEVGPRLSFTTAWSTNAVAVCKACALPEVMRIERSFRYLLSVAPEAAPLEQSQLDNFASLVHDRMTECVYPQKLMSFRNDTIPEPVIQIRVIEEGRAALEAINKTMGLAFDEFDLEYYTKLFGKVIKRNPTNVELFDIAQSNSEHSRHWFFKGALIIDGKLVPETLFDLVKDTLRANKNNSVIGFTDNSSAIRGTAVKPVLPVTPGSPSPMDALHRDFDVLFTAETHNFPCAVAPFPGAETGVGGRIRDTHATGIGSLVGAATAGYCVGNLQMEGSDAPWEDNSFLYPPNLASPLQILIDASNGASDYGNKFGEPLVQGFTRTFGMRLPSGERREWLKPIMFTAGIGQIDHHHLEKGDPKIGMLVVKIGGPAYRIGMGGGAASSMVSGQNTTELDFNAVQRGDAEMSQKLYRVVRTCVEMGDANPIVSIHDQGAGGNCNVVKEIINPQGAEIDVRSIVVGDETMSVLEIWGAEYQEQDALLIRPESEAHMRSICARERVCMAVIGTISGDGRIVLSDSALKKEADARGLPPPMPAVDLDLNQVLGDMPRKRYELNRTLEPTKPLEIPPGQTVMEALKRVLRHPAVCSKRFLTTKVDRCVTGLVAQQQTVGPLQLPLADVAVRAQAHTGITGMAFSIGEQPIKGLLNPKAMARLALGEALTNIVWAKATALNDIKASVNWMYAAKLGGEGAAMYDAAVALKDAMIELEVAVDGGKDSLSMAAEAGGETVKCPGNLVISAYVTCPDITKTVTPDLKLRGESVLLHIDIGKGKRRMGGSCLAQVYGQIGDTPPDVDDVPYLGKVFNAVQGLIDKRTISAGHDISDGGIVVTLLEMAFAGNCGIIVDLPSSKDQSSLNAQFSTLFSEELGHVIEVEQSKREVVIAELQAAGVTCNVLGRVTSKPHVSIAVDGEEVVSITTAALRDVWEFPSFSLEKLQRSSACVKAEQEGLKHRRAPVWKLSFAPSRTSDEVMNSPSKPKVAIIREEGSNGDREMAAMAMAAGFEPWDVTMSDLLQGRAFLKDYRGLVFVGGFSYADVLGSAKGWAGTIRFNESLREQFQDFYNRPNTFTFGVCNGCQLMALLGWVPGVGAGGTLVGFGGDATQPRFVRNESGQFECRFLSVKIEESPAIMLKDMAGTTMGIWVAHGEGKALFPNAAILEQVRRSNLAPMTYCDDDRESTEEYPFNPNGSLQGIAALCSQDGRHLAMMPHPERCFQMWQFPWYPRNWEHMEAAGPSPWLKLFQNAREWCNLHEDGGNT